MPIFWPIEELVGDSIDRARKKWEEQTAQATSAVSAPLDLDIARKRWDELTTPLFDGVRQASDAIGGIGGALNPVQAASSVGRQTIGPADDATKPLMSGGLSMARSKWDELTGGIGQEFGSGFQAGERGRLAEQGGGPRQTLAPDTPAGTLGQAASYLSGPARDTLGPIAQRTREGVEGTTGLARGIGLPEPVARGVGAATGVLGGLQGAIAGSTLESGARNAGLPEPFAQANRIVGETMAPTGLRGDVFGAATKTRLATTGLGAGIGAGVGAAAAGPEASPTERGLGALRGGFTGLQVGSALPDLAGAAVGIGKGIQSTVRAAPKSADLLGAPLGAVLGYNSGDSDQSAGDRLKRAAVGAVLGPGFIKSTRGLIDMGRTLDNLRLLRAVDNLDELPDELSPAAKIADTIEYKLERFNQVGREMEELESQIDSMGEMASVKIEQPSYRKLSPFAGPRLSEADLYEIAARSEINPNAPGWWQAIDAETVRLYRQEAKVRTAPVLTPKQQATALRKQHRALKGEFRSLEQQLEEHYNQAEAVAPEAVDAPAPIDTAYDRVGSITFRADKPPTGAQDLKFSDAGWQRVDRPDGGVRYENPRFQRGPDEATSVSEGNPGDTERVRTAIEEVHGIRSNPDLTGAQKNQAIREVFERNGDLTPEERATLRKGVPRQRPGRAPVPTGPAGPAAGRASMLGPVPPPRPPEAGRVEYPAAQGLQPQSDVPIRPEGVPIPPGTRALGEGNLPTGSESQPPLGDTRQAAIPPVRPGGGPVPPAPEPEGIGVMAPGRPAGTPQIGMEGMPPTREGTVYPERVAGVQPNPEPTGVGIMSTPRSPIEPSVRRGEVDPEGVAGIAPNPEPSGVGIMSTPRSPIEPSVRRGEVDPEGVAGIAPRPDPEGVGIMSVPRSPIEPEVRQGVAYPERIAGLDPAAPPKPEPPLKLTRGGQAVRDRMVAERVSAGASPEEALASVEGEIRLRRDLGTEGKELRVPHWSDDVGDTMRRWNRMRYIGILSNPVGGIRDALFTAVNIPVTYARIAGASAIERGARVNPRERSATFSMLGGFDEGMAAGFRQGIQEFIQVMRKGDATPVAADLQEDRNLPLLGKGKIRERAATVLESTYRLRQASDRFYTTMGNRMASMGLSYREAERAGFTPGTIEHRSFVERTARGVQSTMDRLAAEADKAGQRVPQGTVTPRAAPAGTGPRTAAEATTGTDYDALAKEAFQISRRLVYQQDAGSMTGMFGSARGVGVMSTIIPLYRTIANMGAQAISHHPLVGTAGALVDVARSGLERGAGSVAGPYGAGNARGGSILTRTGSTAVLPLSQRLADSVITGGTMAAAGAALMAGGVITGTGPADASVRRKMQDEGWRPLSIVVGDQGYIPLGQVLGPLALPIAFGATIQEQRMKGGEMDTNAVNKFVQTLVDSQQSQWFQQSGLRDFYETFNALGSPDPDERWRSIERLSSSVFNQWFAPMSGFGRFLNSISDGNVRDPRGLMERWAANYPGLSGMVPERTTESGVPVTRGPGERGVFAASPVQMIQRIQGQRKYYGSPDAGADAEITKAINAVENYRSHPDQYRAPSPRQEELYYANRGAVDPQAAQATRAERVRRRQRTSDIEPGFLGTIVGSASRNPNFTPPGS